ncbi:MAG: hypothetical protein JST84_22275 [Acidobacteria bacterium]|nr:hypothetical protein [Acidobacteriota bacterium]
MSAKNPLSLLFAIPDHPWVDSADGAAVRIAMTVVTAGEHEGVLQKVIAEAEGLGAQASRLLRARATSLACWRRKFLYLQGTRSPRPGSHRCARSASGTLALPGASRDDSVTVELSAQSGKIFADLTIGADVASTQSLQANENISCPAVKLHGAGFIVTPEEAANLGSGKIAGLEKQSKLQNIASSLAAPRISKSTRHNPKRLRFRNIAD